MFSGLWILFCIGVLGLTVGFSVAILLKSRQTKKVLRDHNKEV